MGKRLDKLYMDNIIDLNASTKSGQMTYENFEKRVAGWWKNHPKYKTKYQAAKAMMRTSTYTHTAEAKAKAQAEYLKEAMDKFASKEYDEGTVFRDFRKFNRDDKGRFQGWNAVHWDKTHKMDVFMGANGQLYGIDRSDSPEDITIIKL